MAESGVKVAGEVNKGGQAIESGVIGSEAIESGLRQLERLGDLVQGSRAWVTTKSPKQNTQKSHRNCW